MILHIKNMVCDRCNRAVKDTLETAGLHPTSVTLGEVVLQEETLTQEKLTELDGALNALGFERIDDRKSMLVSKIKSTVINIVHAPKGMDLKLNWSAILAEELHYDYNYLSNLFSSVEGITLEQYIIRQKIERVKELLFYDQLNLSEIANLLAYSSVQHLSNQFKKVTGLTPSAFKKLHEAAQKRKSLDAV